MKYKFNVGEEVLVKYYNAAKFTKCSVKVGRIESIRVNKNNMVVYSVSIKGNKNLKKCLSMDLTKKEPVKKIEEKKPTKQTYNVHYSFYLSDSIEVEAESEQEAEEIVDQMICNGEIGNLNEMDVGDQKIWCD